MAATPLGIVKEFMKTMEALDYALQFVQRDD